MEKKLKKKSGNSLLKKVFVSIGMVYVLGIFFKLYSGLYLVMAPYLESFYASQFMSARLIPVADLLISPLRILVSLTTVILPAILIVWLFMFLLKKINIYKELELKWIMIIILLMFAVSI